MNDANFIGSLEIALEAFTDDIVPAILGNKADGFKITYNVCDDCKGVEFEWAWDRLGDEPRRRKFAKRGKRSNSDLLDEIKAYFFDLSVMLANL